MNIWKYFWKDEKEMKELKENHDPKPGEIWKLKCGTDTMGPWAVSEDRKMEVQILDGKDGWVRYKINAFFNDERQKVEYFKKIYEKM